MDGACWVCFFVAGIHPSRTWTSGSFESVWWNACLHRLDLGLYSHRKEFWGMEFESMLTPREKSPLPKMSPEEDRTRDAVDSEPKHYQLSYSGPQILGMNPIFVRIHKQNGWFSFKILIAMMPLFVEGAWRTTSSFSKNVIKVLYTVFSCAVQYSEVHAAQCGKGHQELILHCSCSQTYIKHRSPLPLFPGVVIPTGEMRANN